MKIRFTKKDFLTIPNLLSLLRILLIAPFVCFFISGNYVAAAVMLIISGLSDACDGYIARTFNQVTSVGKLLDPIADKLTLFAIMVCITLFSPVLTPFMIILIIKDLFMLIYHGLLNRISQGGVQLREPFALGNSAVRYNRLYALCPCEILPHIL